MVNAGSAPPPSASLMASDALVERTRVAASAVTGWLPLAEPNGWSPDHVRVLAVHAALAALCRPLLTAGEVEALTDPFRGPERPRIVARGPARDGRRSP